MVAQGSDDIPVFLGQTAHHAKVQRHPFRETLFPIPKICQKPLRVNFPHFAFE
jgi:hypothetical protein